MNLSRAPSQDSLSLCADSPPTRKLLSGPRETVKVTDVRLRVGVEHDSRIARATEHLYQPVLVKARSYLAGLDRPLVSSVHVAVDDAQHDSPAVQPPAPQETAEQHEEAEEEKHF